MATWDVTIEGVLRERWDNTAPGSVQCFNGDGSPNGDPQPITPVQLDRLNKLIERRELKASALNAHQNNQTYLAKGTWTANEAIAQVEKLTQQVNALIKIVGQDVLNLDGSKN